MLMFRAMIGRSFPSVFACGTRRIQVESFGIMQELHIGMDVLTARGDALVGMVFPLSGFPEAGFQALPRRVGHQFHHLVDGAGFQRSIRCWNHRRLV